MAQVGYALYTHKDVPAIERLVNRLTAEPSTAGVAIHHDSDAGPLHAQFDHPDKVAVVAKPYSVKWGHWSQVQASIASLRLLFARFSCDWAITLSGQDYPIVSLPKVSSFFDTAEVDAFVESEPVRARFSEDYERGRRRGWRYDYRYYAIPDSVNRRVSRKVIRTLARFESLFCGTWWFDHDRVYFGIRPLTERPEMVGGSDWLMVNRKAAHVLFTRFMDRKFTKHFRRSMIPSEAFFATALDGQVAVDGDPRRYAQFPDFYAEHPILLTMDHLDSLESSDALFARKVDSSKSKELLNALDRQTSVA